MREKITLIGGGGRCRSCIDVIEQEGKYQVAGIVDLPEKQGQSVLGCQLTEEPNNAPYYILR